jgi:biopolymer transport protein ExbD
VRLLFYGQRACPDLVYPLPSNPINFMKIRLLIALLALGLCTDALAEEKREYSRISFVAPASNANPVKRDKFVLLVIEGPVITADATPIPNGAVVSHVNGLLKAKGVSYVGVHIREGVKYGDVVRALDTLSQTDAKNIGVSMTELPLGVNPE